jgi:hemerythrin-like domain-containing protein
MLIVLAMLGIAGAAARPTDGFRREHAEIKTHLEHVRTWAGELVADKPDARAAKMKKIVGFFDEHIRPHAAWEEKVLYPAVDRRAGNATYPFTSTMRREHQIVARYLDELTKLAAAPSPDAVAFQRRTDNLLGLLTAHFEEEEEVLLPILDKTMTPADFDREIGHGAHHE